MTKHVHLVVVVSSFGGIIVDWQRKHVNKLSKFFIARILVVSFFSKVDMVTFLSMSEYANSINQIFTKQYDGKVIENSN